MSHVIQACAQEAVKRKYSYFAIKNYGQCSWGPQGLSISSRRVSVSWCFYGLGGPWVVSVYKIEKPTGKYRLTLSRFLRTLHPINDVKIITESYQITAWLNMQKMSTDKNIPIIADDLEQYHAELKILDLSHVNCGVRFLFFNSSQEE